MRKKSKKINQLKRRFIQKDNKKFKLIYTAKDIEVLEGLELVRKRPGMYIGVTDIMAMHHLVSEVLDNSMDEVVAGFANKVEIKFVSQDTIEISDNGRGIPVDKHPKFKIPAVEVIMTNYILGASFQKNNYKTSGGLHGVGISVVNALSKKLTLKLQEIKNILYKLIVKVL